MTSTKITSSSVAEIDAKLKTYFGDMVKIEYLENCLRQMLPNDAARFCHIKLAELYSNRLMYGPAAKQLDAAAETAVTFKDKIDFYLKEISFLVKLNDFMKIDHAFKKAMLCANNSNEKQIVQNALKGELLSQAKEYESKNKRSNACQIYEKLVSMSIISDEERKALIEKLSKLNYSLGKIKEGTRFEMMSKKPIERPRNLDDEGREVRKVSMADLGIEWV
jgi:hypothetical protein